MTVAKGLSSGYQPISATILGGDIARTIEESEQEMEHGYTYSGHPVAASVALANIREMQRLDLVGEDGQQRASYFQQAIATLDDHPLIGEVRGIGFLGAVEIVADKQTNARFHEDDEAGTVCRNFCVTNGLISRAVGDTMVMSPPLIISEPEIDELVTKLRLSLDQTGEALTSA
jgi:putrescine aminotransferase